jgi:GNAT superfamily N-acetyltransferase
MQVVATLCAPLLRILDTIADGDFYLQAIAVDKGHRKQGLGSSLIDSIEDRGRCRRRQPGYPWMWPPATEGARRLYERRGMTVESEWPKRLTIPGLRFLRMTKTL